MTQPASEAPKAANSALKAMEASLLALIQRMEDATADAETPDAVKALDAQIVAANARVTAIGKVRFAGETAEITSAARGVVAAIPKAQDALAHLDHVETMVVEVTGALALVDKAIAVAGKAAA